MGRGAGTRIVTIIGGLLVFGLVLRLMGAVFTSILPGSLVQILSDGWSLLFSFISPAMAAIAAVAILGAIIWVVMAWMRR